jgi:hypothetical protein
MKTELKLNTHRALYVIKHETEKIAGIEDISSKTRSREYVFARYLYIRAAREFTDYAMSAIGGGINRDHATVMHSLVNLQWDFDHNKDLQTKYDELAIILTNKLNINAVNTLDEQIAKLQDQLYSLQKRRQILINYESSDTKLQDKENVQVFWS